MAGDHELLRTLCACHTILKEHAFVLRSHSRVSEVTHQTDLYNIDDACRVEEYVDAEFYNGEALSWRFEVTLLAEKKFVIEADVTRIHAQGQDVVVTMADEAEVEIEHASNHLPLVTRELVSWLPTQLGC